MVRVTQFTMDERRIVSRMLQFLPHLARRSITFDRGTEFTDWPYPQATWFCDPQ